MIWLRMTLGEGISFLDYTIVFNDEINRVIMILYIYKGEHLHDVLYMAFQRTRQCVCVFLAATWPHPDTRILARASYRKARRKVSQDKHIVKCPYLFSHLNCQFYCTSVIISIYRFLVLTAGIMSTPLLHTELNNH